MPSAALRPALVPQILFLNVLSSSSYQVDSVLIVDFGNLYNHLITDVHHIFNLVDSVVGHLGYVEKAFFFQGELG